MVCAEHLRRARARTAVRERPMTSGTAAAMAATSRGFTSRPQCASMTSGIPPRANATTGVPHASASATTRPYGSSQRGSSAAHQTRQLILVQMARVGGPCTEFRLDLLAKVVHVSDGPGQDEAQA